MSFMNWWTCSLYFYLIVRTWGWEQGAGILICTSLYNLTSLQRSKLSDCNYLVFLNGPGQSYVNLPCIHENNEKLYQNFGEVQNLRLPYFIYHIAKQRNRLWHKMFPHHYNLFPRLFPSTLPFIFHPEQFLLVKSQVVQSFSPPQFVKLDWNFLMCRRKVPLLFAKISQKYLTVLSWSHLKCSVIHFFPKSFLGGFELPLWQWGQEKNEGKK